MQQVLLNINSILSQYCISSKESMFDKLINLFICKVTDELLNSKAPRLIIVNISSDYTLLDVLNSLYKTGMKQFLNETVERPSKDDLSRVLQYISPDPQSTLIQSMTKNFNELLYYNNGDFSFIDVHNECSFKLNAVILTKLINEISSIKLTEMNSQFIGDLFENSFLKSSRQNSGQFFTPQPITKFIIDSLPIDDMLSKKMNTLKAMDYSSGSGHFIIELAKKYNNINISGIELDTKLAKVSKLSAMINNLNNINIQANNALMKDTIQYNSIDILLGNPPYSVSGFAEFLSDSDLNQYDLSKFINDTTLDNSIEAFFIERAKQIMSDGAIAGIILPASILTNESSLYNETRNIILKYFQIISIVELGSQTFGKTGTNTIILFLKKRCCNNIQSNALISPPSQLEHWNNRISILFNDGLSNDCLYNDVDYIQAYCDIIGINIDEYNKILTDDIDSMNNCNLLNSYKKAYKRGGEFSNYVRESEKIKLFNFCLNCDDGILVVRSPQDTKEQREFLGYEWSSNGIKLYGSSVLSEIANDIKSCYNGESVDSVYNKCISDLIDFSGIFSNKICL